MVMQVVGQSELVVGDNDDEAGQAENAAFQSRAAAGADSQIRRDHAPGDVSGFNRQRQPFMLASENFERLAALSLRSQNNLDFAIKCRKHFARDLPADPAHIGQAHADQYPAQLGRIAPGQGRGAGGEEFFPGGVELRTE